MIKKYRKRKKSDAAKNIRKLLITMDFTGFYPPPLYHAENQRDAKASFCLRVGGNIKHESAASQFCTLGLMRQN